MGGGVRKNGYTLVCCMVAVLVGGQWYAVVSLYGQSCFAMMSSKTPPIYGCFCHQFLQNNNYLCGF